MTHRQIQHHPTPERQRAATRHMTHHMTNRMTLQATDHERMKKTLVDLNRTCSEMNVSVHHHLVAVAYTLFIFHNGKSRSFLIYSELMFSENPEGKDNRGDKSDDVTHSQKPPATEQYQIATPAQKLQSLQFSGHCVSVCETAETGTCGYVTS